MSVIYTDGIGQTPCSFEHYLVSNKLIFIILFNDLC